MRRLLLIIPLVVVIALGAVFYRSLQSPSDPFASVLIDKSVPAFDLPAISTLKSDGANLTPVPPGLASADLLGQVTLVNVFGSWCAACRIEHPLLTEISDADLVPVMGIDWKDKPGNGAQWLARFGNPYTRIGDDQAGRTAIDFGVTGAPETFVVDHTGRIRYKHVGPITPRDWTRTLYPLVQQLQAEAGA